MHLLQVPAKYEAPTDFVNHGTKLGAKIAMKTGELKKVQMISFLSRARAESDRCCSNDEGLLT